MASRVIADYLEVLQTEGAAARVTQVSAETLTHSNTAAGGRVTQLSAEALTANNSAALARATMLSAEVLQTVGTNPAIGRVTMVSAEVLMSVGDAPAAGGSAGGQTGGLGPWRTGSGFAIVQPGMLPTARW